MSIISSEVYLGLNQKEDQEYSSTCLQLVSLSSNLVLSKEIIEHVLPNLTRDDIIKIQNDLVATVPITDKRINKTLCKLKVASQLQLEDILENMGFGFGLALDLISGEGSSKESSCFFLDIQKFIISDDPFPDDRPDGDDDVEPHAEIEEQKPMLKAMAAGG